MNQSHSLVSLPMQQFFKINARIPIQYTKNKKTIQEYPILKKYFDKKLQFTQNSTDSYTKKLRPLKIKTYLQEQQFKKKNIPGPGTYQLKGIITDSSDMNRKNSKRFKSERKTFVNEIFDYNKKIKSPGPSQYQQTQNLTTLNKNSKSFLNSRLVLEKMKNQERYFYFDEEIVRATQTPSVGQYEIISQIKKDFRIRRDSPQNNIKLLKANSQKKLMRDKARKSPDMCTYNPQQCSFFTFNTANKNKSSKKLLNIGERFKTLPQGSMLSPDKYNLIHQWKGKNSKIKNTQKGILDFISKPQKRVYN